MQGGGEAGRGWTEVSRLPARRPRALAFTVEGENESSAREEKEGAWVAAGKGFKQLSKQDSLH